MIRRPPRSTRTDTLFPDTTLFRSKGLDLRGNDISIAQGRQWARDVRERLGPDYDVNFETFRANPANHPLHIEHDPKPRGGKGRKRRRPRPAELTAGRGQCVPKTTMNPN